MAMVVFAAIDFMESVPAVIQDESCVHFWVLHQHSDELFLPYWWLSKHILKRDLQIKSHSPAQESPLDNTKTNSLHREALTSFSFNPDTSRADFADHPLCQIILKNLNFLLQPPQLLHFHF